MSVQPEEFLSQGPSAFLDQPSFLEQGPQPPVAPRVEDSPDFAKIALGVAAALVVLRLLVRSELFKEDVRTQEDIDAAARRIYKKVFPAWMHVSVPAIAQAYRLGATESVSYAELEKMATAYAEELGDYIHESSILAVTDGFNAQVNAGWSERLAWQRAREAYGLDTQQMRSYVKGLMAKDKDSYVTEPIPASSRAAVDRLFLVRADKLGTNEAFRATQLGRNLVWLSLQASGQIPDGTMKRWVTADDERVCPVCGPLHMVEVPLHRRFTSGGRHFYAPGVHPNCRCTLEIVYPEDDLQVNVAKAMPGDPYNRDAEGQFARKEERVAKPLARGLAKPLAETKPLAAQPLARVAQPLEQRTAKPLDAVEAKPLGQERQAVSLADMEAEAVRLAGAQAVHEAEQAAEAASAKSRALTEGDVHTAAAEARRGLDAHKHQARQMTIGFERKLRPDDPQLHVSTIYAPATHYVTTRRFPPSQFADGALIPLGSRNGGRIERIPGWFQEDDDDARVMDLEMSDAFSDAWDTFMELPEGGFSFISANRMARDADKELADTIADVTEYGHSVDPKFIEQRKAMNGMSQRDLIRFAHSVLRRSPDARMYLEISDIEDDPANDVASRILYALQSEDDDNYHWRREHGRDKNDGAWLSHLSELAQDNDTWGVDVEDLPNVKTLRESYSQKVQVTPIFFRIKGWYGTAPQSSGTPLGMGRLTKAGLISGTYRVDGPPKFYPVPERLSDDETGETIDRVMIVDLAFQSKDVPGVEETEETDEGR